VAQEELDLGIPIVKAVIPRVTFYPRTYRRLLRNADKASRCMHCRMNASRFLGGEPVTGWARECDITILDASVLITQRDGSTLHLCAQHAQEHEDRGGRDG
jgi:hypothetical protein